MSGAEVYRVPRSEMLSPRNDIPVIPQQCDVVSVSDYDTLRTANQRLEGEVRDLTERRNDLARKLIGKNQEWKALIALLQEIYQTPLDRFYRDGLNVKINAELVRAAALSTTANGEGE